MRLRPLHVVVCGIVASIGCGQAPSTGASGEKVLGPGRFADSAIQRTTAPWDGAATQLYLAEKPLVQGKATGPFVSVRVYKEAGQLSNQHVRLDSKESKAGGISAIDQQGNGLPLSWVEIDFEEVREGAAVQGKYEVAFPDGKRERGRFVAKWWKSEGRGG